MSFIDSQLIEFGSKILSLSNSQQMKATKGAWTEPGWCGGDEGMGKDGKDQAKDGMDRGDASENELSRAALT